MSWASTFTESARTTDRFTGRDDHRLLLVAGLVGETGSIVAEFKKAEREGDAYPLYHARLTEEIGDFLWYYSRIADTHGMPDVVEGITDSSGSKQGEAGGIDHHIDLAAAVGSLAEDAHGGMAPSKPAMRRICQALCNVARSAGVNIELAAKENLAKTDSRWPAERQPSPLFDVAFPEEEQLPRKLLIEFRQKTLKGGKNVILRCNGLNFGDRLNDNILDEDGYRFHDVFHLAYYAHLGWSPVMRSLLRCKRKSDPVVDESQDGARAMIIEEAISATVFARAKQLKLFESVSHVDYDLLKMISEFVRGYEVESVPLWQWEEAILSGFGAFRRLLSDEGGSIRVDLHARRLTHL